MLIGFRQPKTKDDMNTNDELTTSVPTLANTVLADGSLSLSDEPLRALSWKQPFASAMLVGKVETRSWNTNYRGLVLICASQKGYQLNQLLDISYMELMDKMFNKISPKFLPPHFESQNGVALAVAKLVDCRPMKIEDEDQTFVKFNSNLYCHFYDDVRLIKPFSWKGCQGWKVLSEEQKSSIVFI
jgi:hypothetical protein